MKYHCPECHAVFYEQNAHCEEWRSEDKAFGCPHCKTFFRKQRVDIASEPEADIAMRAILGAIVVDVLVGYFFPELEITLALLLVIGVFLVGLLFVKVRNQGWKGALKAGHQVKLIPVESCKSNPTS